MGIPLRTSCLVCVFMCTRVRWVFGRVCVTCVYTCGHICLFTFGEPLLPFLYLTFFHTYTHLTLTLNLRWQATFGEARMGTDKFVFLRT